MRNKKERDQMRKNWPRIHEGSRWPFGSPTRIPAAPEEPSITAERAEPMYFDLFETEQPAASQTAPPPPPPSAPVIAPDRAPLIEEADAAIFEIEFDATPGQGPTARSLDAELDPNAASGPTEDRPWRVLALYYDVAQKRLRWRRMLVISVPQGVSFDGLCDGLVHLGVEVREVPCGTSIPVDPELAESPAETEPGIHPDAPQLLFAERSRLADEINSHLANLELIEPIGSDEVDVDLTDCDPPRN